MHFNHGLNMANAAPLNYTTAPRLELHGLCLRSLPQTLPNARQNHKQHSRSILVASVENHERVRLAKEVLFVQLVGTKLHGGTIL